MLFCHTAISSASCTGAVFPLVYDIVIHTNKYHKLLVIYKMWVVVGSCGRKKYKGNK